MEQKPKLLSFKKQFIGILLILLCLVPAILIINSGSDEIKWSDFFKFLGNLKNPFFLIPAFLCVIVSIFWESLGLHYILVKLKAPSTIASSYVYATADIYFSALTPSATGGQPASGYYMTKNKISASDATVALILNLAQFFLSLILLSLFAFAIAPEIILDSDKPEVIFLFFGGLTVCCVLLAFFIICMLWPGPCRFIGRVGIKALTAVHIIKNRQKCEESFQEYLTEYEASFKTVLRCPSILWVSLFTNILQKLTIYLVPVFVILAVNGTADVFDILTRQSLLGMAANCIPIPGSVGVSEILFLDLISPILSPSLRMSTMFLTRGISYFFSLVFSGIFTLVWHLRHVVTTNNKK